MSVISLSYRIFYCICQSNLYKRIKYFFEDMITLLSRRLYSQLLSREKRREWRMRCDYLRQRINYFYDLLHSNGVKFLQSTVIFVATCNCHSAGVLHGTKTQLEHKISIFFFRAQVARCTIYCFQKSETKDSTLASKWNNVDRLYQLDI